jgi:hypothetical protein
MTAFLVIWWIGMIGCGCLYWFKYSTTNDNYVMRRYKTWFAALFWPIFLLRLFLSGQNAEARQGETEDAKRRILGD